MLLERRRSSANARQGAPYRVANQSVPTVCGILAAAAISVLATGYTFNDLLVYLPLTEHLRDASLYPGSPLVEHLLGMPYPLYRIYSSVYDQHVLFGFWLVVRIATVGALYALARQVVRDRLAAALAVSLVVFTPGTYGTLGLTQVLLSEPVQYAVALPLCLFALYAALRGHALPAFVLAGLACDLQPILGFVAAVLVAGGVIADSTRGRSRASYAGIVLSAAAGFLVALPVLVVTVASSSIWSGVTTAEFVDMVRFGAYFHVLPGAFPVDEYIGTATVAGFAVLGLFEEALRRYRRTLLVWLGLIVVLCLFGAVFTEVIPLPLVMKMMPFRATLFFKVLGLICAGVYLRAELAREPVLGWIVAGLVVVGMTVINPAAIAGLSVALVLSVRRRLNSSSRDPQFVVGPVGRYFARLLVVLPTLLFLATLPYRLDAVRIPGHYPPTALELAADWARAATAKDAVFITPPDADMAEFTLAAQRTTLGDAKSAGQALFDSQFGRVLYRRLADLGCRVPEGPWCVGNTYASFDEATFQALATRYGACYALTRAQHTPALPEVYRNDSFHVYALCAS